jgi:hypothetical protein
MNKKYFVTENVLSDELEAKRAHVLSADSLQGAVASTIEEVRSRLNTIRDEETARYDQAERERDQLERVDEPRPLFEKRYEREQKIIYTADSETRLTDAEWTLLKQYREEKKSLNPLMRSSARRAEYELLANREKLYEQGLDEALRRFRQDEIPRMSKEHEDEERRYEEYAVKAYALEEAMRAASRVLVLRLPAIEKEFEVIGRVGFPWIQGVDKDASLSEIGEAMTRCYKSIPERTRQSIEREIRHDRKALDRLRDFPSFDD